MTRIIFCQKLHKEAEGLVAQPYPGEFGKRIYENISQEAWQLWIEHQTRLINEYRLNLMEAKSRQFLPKKWRNSFLVIPAPLRPASSPLKIQLDSMQLNRFNYNPRWRKLRT